MVSANSRRLREEVVSAKAAEKGVALMTRSLAEDGPLTRPEIGPRLRAARVPVAGQALVHLLLLASLHALIVRGPMVRGQHAFVLTRDWLGESKPVERDRALAELARRYLAGHGPATDRDLAYWSGLALRDARAGLLGISSEVVERGGLVSLKGKKPTSPLPPPRLLGSFDPLLLGWKSREPVLGADALAVVTGGLFRPFAIVRGRAAATWTLRSGEIKMKPLRPLFKTGLGGLERRWMGRAALSQPCLGQPARAVAAAPCGGHANRMTKACRAASTGRAPVGTGDRWASTGRRTPVGSR